MGRESSRESTGDISGSGSLPSISAPVWILLLWTPALLILLAAAAGPGTLIHGAVDLAFRPFRHQTPERSLLLFGNTLVVCARCTGFYGGLGVFGIIAALAYTFGLKKRVPRRAFILVLPLAIDGTANLLGIWATGALLRSVTGIMAAAPVAAALLGNRYETVRE